LENINYEKGEIDMPEALVTIFAIIFIVGFFFLHYMFLRWIWRFAGRRASEKGLNRINNLANEFPDIWNHFSVVDTEKPNIIPEASYNRLIYNNLPGNLQKSEPILFIKPDIELKWTYGLSKKGDIRRLENGMIWVTALKSIIKISDILELSGSQHYKHLVNVLDGYTIVAENNGAYLYCLTKSDSDLPIIDTIENQLKIICSAMKVDYNAMGLGDYDPGSSTYMGFGSLKAVGVGALLSAGSSINRSVQKHSFSRASACAAINNVINYFNDVYNA